jgi:hypothetical protein
MWFHEEVCQPSYHVNTCLKWNRICYQRGTNREVKIKQPNQNPMNPTHCEKEQLKKEAKNKQKRINSCFQKKITKRCLMRSLLFSLPQYPSKRERWMPSYKSIPRSPRITKECLFDSSR